MKNISIAIILIIALYSKLTSSKHHLALTNDHKVHFTVSSFGYSSGGKLDVKAQNLTLWPDSNGPGKDNSQASSSSGHSASSGSKPDKERNYEEVKLDYPSCMLGNDTYDLGERWNPNLPPFGVQVCVLCECIIRQRKNCYESKVICRRITNECPIIDSCPDGKKPVTTVGQCCKKCTLDAPSPIRPASTTLTSASPEPTPHQSDEFNTTSQYATSSTLSSPSPIVLMSDKSKYKNERIKEYQSILKTLQACQKRDGDKHTNVLVNQVKPSTSKGTKNDLNGIDTRLAFKSLHDSQNNYLSSSSSTKNREQPEHKTAKTLDDNSRQDSQHPNDVQIGGSNNNSNRFAVSPNQPTTKKPQPLPQPSPTTCILGNDVYHIGDRWHPVLPPFGVQVCVLCDCVVRQRRGCYESRVTCRRLNNECPKIDFCSDGKSKPVSVAGQCCRSCNDGQPQGNNNFTTVIISNLMTPDKLPQYEKVMKEYLSIMKAFPACTERKREFENLYNNNNNNTSRQTTTNVKRVKRVSFNETPPIYLGDSSSQQYKH